MRIEYWSDYACPYCYIGETRLHKAVEKLGLEKEISYEPRAFELDPSAPVEVQSDTPTRFARKYRMPLEQAISQIEHISRLGREAGLDFKYMTTQYTNTFNAHRLMKLALSTGDWNIASKTNTLLFDAYFTKNLKLSENETLLAVGMAAGLEESAIKALLDSDEFAQAVRDDEATAARMGIHGVPYFVFPDGLTIPGALSEKDFILALERNIEAGKLNAMTCGPEGCAVKF